MNIGSKLQVAKNVVTSKAGRQVLQVQKSSPHLLFGAGVIGVVASTVLACKATLKLEGVLDENERQQELARDLLESGDSRYSAKDFTKDSAKLKTRLVVDVSRLYLPAVVVGATAVCALGGSHVILTKRNAAVTAAYATLSKGFEEYRERVTAEFGPDKDRELRYGVEEREVAVDDEKGRTSVETIKSYDTKVSQYAKLFSADTSTSWSPQPEYNFVFLRAQQQYANDVLNAKGHIFLSEIYDSLGLERTPDSILTGWVKNNKRNKDANGFVDFGIFDNPDRFHDFVTGREGAILLDFNVDGVVYDLI